MDDLSHIQGVWKLANPGDGNITHWDIYEDTITEAGPASSDPEPTRRINLDSESKRITLVKFGALTIEKGFYKLDGDSLEISLGHDDASNPIKPDCPAYFRFSRANGRPPFLVYRPAPWHDSVLGEMVWDSQLRNWHATVDIPPPIKSLECVIYDRPAFDTNIRLLRDFVSWLRSHTQEFVHEVAYQSSNMDLIWDDIEDEFVAENIRITHASILDAVVCVVADPRSFIDDEHVFHITLDESYNIIDMHK